MTLHQLLYFLTKTSAKLTCTLTLAYIYIWSYVFIQLVLVLKDSRRPLPSSVILLEDSEDSTCSHTCDHGLLPWKNLKQNQQNKRWLEWSLGKTICKLQSLFPVESCSVHLTPPATRMAMHTWDVTIQESSLETGIQGFHLGLVVWAPHAW